jgi:hypothetical protein
MADGISPRIGLRLRCRSLRGSGSGIEAINARV